MVLINICRDLGMISRGLRKGLSRAEPDPQNPAEGPEAGEGRLRVINVIPQHVEGVVHAASEVEAVKVLGEVLPPAHVQQVAGELVKALQLRSGGSERK